MTAPLEYRGKLIVQVWNGYKLADQYGAQHPETYGTLDAARKAIDSNAKRGAA